MIYLELIFVNGCKLCLEKNLKYLTRGWIRWPEILDIYFLLLEEWKMCIWDVPHLINLGLCCLLQILKATTVNVSSLSSLKHPVLLFFVGLTWWTIVFGKIWWKMPVKINFQKMSFKRDLKKSKCILFWLVQPLATTASWVVRFPFWIIKELSLEND